MSHAISDRPAPTPAIGTSTGRLGRIARPVVTVLIVAGLAGAVYATRDRWWASVFPAEPTAEAVADTGPDDHAEPSDTVKLSEQAQRNLSLDAQPLAAGTYRKSISVPGIIVDRPGFGDRGVAAPATGVVTQIHHVAGDTVRPGELLFTVRLLSESLHLSQSELFKATQNLKPATALRDRLTASAGAVPEAKRIEAENEITRLELAITAYRQELLTRGLRDEQIDAAAQGKFVTEIRIVAPDRPAESQDPVAATSPADAGTDAERAYEIQEVTVDLGQQVQPGQTLCLLANHRLLAVEGRAFRDEAPMLERVVREGWPVTVEFGEADVRDWPTLERTFPVTYIANTIDPETRTFRFLMPLVNQSRVIDRAGETQHLWRFRPGQRVRLKVPVEELTDVFVLPSDAVARDGAEAYVFRQSGDTFERLPVHVVYRERDTVVVANDGSVLPGAYVAQAGAAQLNRMVNSQSGTVPKGFHVHADGSVHMGSH